MQLPPSPNWYAPGAVSVSCRGELAYAANSRIVIIEPRPENWPLVSILSRAHSERILCVMWVASQKGDLASAGDDGKVKFWNSKEKRLIAEHGEHGQNKIVSISSFKLAPKYIVSGDVRAQIILWNVDNAVARRSLAIGKLPALSVIACSPFDDFTLALGFQQGTFMLIDVRGRGQMLWKMTKGHDDMLTNISWCPSPTSVFGENPLVVTSSKTKVLIWDLKEKREALYFRPPLRYKSKTGQNLSWITAHWLDKDTILTSGHQSEILLWDVKALKDKLHSEPRVVHKLHSREIFNIASCIDQVQGTAVIWTSSQDRRLVQFRLDTSKVASDDPVLQNTSFDIPLGDCLLDLQTLGGFLNCVRTCPTDGSVIAVAVGDGQIRAINSANPALATGSPIWMKWKPLCVAWHPETEGLLAFGAEDGKVGLINTLKKAPAMVFGNSLKGNVYKIQWVKWKIGDGSEKYCVWACGGKSIGIFDSDDLNAGTIVRVSNLIDDESAFSLKVKDATDFSWNHDYSLLAVGGVTGIVSIFEKADYKLKPVGYLMASRKLVNTMEWLPKGKAKGTEDIWLAMGSDESMVKVFCVSRLLEAGKSSAEPVTIQPHSILEGHKDKVCAVAWNPHTRGILATASGDTTVRVWDAFTGKTTAIFSDPNGGRFFSVEWSEWEEDLVYCGGDRNCMYSFKPSENCPSRDAYGERKADKKEFLPSGVKKSKSFFPLVAIAENRGKEHLYADCFALMDYVFSGKNCEEISVEFYLEGEKFLKCMQKELANHLKLQNAPFYIMLHGWANRPWEEAAEKLVEQGLVDDFLFAVNKSDSSGWIAAADHYAQELLKTADGDPVLIRKAATFFHLAGKSDDVMEVLMSNSFVREALAYAKLNFPPGDEKIKTVTKLYARKLSESSLMELAAKVYITLGDVDSAIQVIMRRADPQASLLASELAKHSASQFMSKVYAMQCIYDALLRSEHSVARRAVALNNSFSWCEPVILVHEALSKKVDTEQPSKVRPSEEKAGSENGYGADELSDLESAVKQTNGSADAKANGRSSVSEPEEVVSDGNQSGCPDASDKPPVEKSWIPDLFHSLQSRWSPDSREAIVSEIKKNFCTGQIPSQSKQILVHLSGRLAVSLLTHESIEDLGKLLEQIAGEYQAVSQEQVISELTKQFS